MFGRLMAATIAFVMATMGAFSHAATCTVLPHDNVAEGDTVYSPNVCNRELIDKFLTDFGFDRGDWNDGFGYEDMCNIDLPLNRTFSALWALLFSSPNPATSTGDFSGDFLRWAYNYAEQGIDELDARCAGHDGALAHTKAGPIIDNYTELYLPFFYGYSVPERARTIVHEVRHAEWRMHDDCSCPRRRSCDARWDDGGANSYQIFYLWWFVHSGLNTTTAMQRRAQDRANDILERGFWTPTYFRLNYMR
jgi:hypothetical protein